MVALLWGKSRWATGLVAAAVCMLFAAPAGALVVWSTGNGPGGNDTLASVHRDGSGLKRVFTVPFTQGFSTLGVAADKEHVYWSTRSGNIGRSNIDGTDPNPDFIKMRSGALGGLAVDGNYIYWANRRGAIGRAKLDGTEVDPLFIFTAYNRQTHGGTRGLAVDAGHVYWTNDTDTGSSETGSIGRANLDGSGVDQNFIPNVLAQGLAVNRTDIYWSNNTVSPNTASIGQAQIDGKGVHPNFIPLPVDSAPLGIAVGANHVYWSMFVAGGDGIGRANLNGTNRDLNFVEGTSPAYGVALTPKAPG